MSHCICCDISLTSRVVTKSHKENIAPKPTLEPSSPLSTPPSSPSKRRGSMSHYSDLESSPSKRRGIGERAALRMSAEERKPLFTSEVTNVLAPKWAYREPVYQTPTKKGRMNAKWVGSPMHVDGGDYNAILEGRKRLPAPFGSPMKIDRPAMVGGGPPRKPLPRPLLVGMPARNRARGKHKTAS